MLIAVSPVNHKFVSPVRHVKPAKHVKPKHVNHIHVNLVSLVKGVKQNVLSVVVRSVKGVRTVLVILINYSRIIKMKFCIYDKNKNYEDINNRYHISLINNVLTFSSPFDADDYISSEVVIDATKLKSYVRYFVYFSNVRNQTMVSNTEELDIPYGGSFQDIFTLSLLFTWKIYITVWKTEAEEVFILGQGTNIHPLTDNFDVIKQGDDPHSKWLKENSADPECEARWLHSWDLLKLTANYRKDLMFRALPMLDIEVDVLLEVIKHLLNALPDVKADIQANSPNVLPLLETMQVDNILTRGKLENIKFMLSDKNRIRNIQAKYDDQYSLLEKNA
jgi:hypothetical protein